jgi:hypothetical protein
MDIKQHLPKPGYFSFFAELELDKLQYLVTTLERDLDNWQAEVKDKYPERYAGQNGIEPEESHSEEIENIKELRDLVKELSALGIYMVLENLIKKAMRRVYLNLDESQRNKKLHLIHKWEFLKKELKETCQLELSEVNEYSTIDELRCLNNVIKHAGRIVTEKLAAFPSWEANLGFEVDTNRIKLDKFCKSIPLFIFDMVARINKHLSESTS